MTCAARTDRVAAACRAGAGLLLTAALAGSCASDGGVRENGAAAPIRTVADDRPLSVDAVLGLHDHADGRRGTVLVFVRPDCPIANRYAPELARIVHDYEPQNLRFFVVYADPREELASMEAHRLEYSIPCPGLFDPEHVLVARTGATITPQAAVHDPDGALVYLGRIDDQYSGYDRWRVNPRRQDLRRALDDLLAGRPVEVPRTEAIGCYLGDLR